MKSILTHDVGLVVGNCPLCGGGLPLRGLEGHPNGVEVALVGLICRVDKLAELSPIIRR